jgi:colicin import membrane protein
MHRNFRQSSAFRLVLAALLAALPGLCFAQDSDAGAAALLSKTYPVGTIQSDEAADDALRRASEARTEVENKFADEQRICYSRFFVNSCLSDAKEERHLALTRIKRVEIEANEFKRAFQVKEHDRIAAQKATEDRSLQVSTENKTKPPEKRVAAHEEKLKQIEKEELADAPQRARNVAAYEEKVKEAEERKRKAAEQKAK